MIHKASPGDSKLADRTATDREPDQAGTVERAEPGRASAPEAAPIHDPETRLLAAIAVLGTAPLSEDMTDEVLELQRQARERRGSRPLLRAVNPLVNDESPEESRR